MPKKEYFLTQEGFDNLKKELERLKTQELPVAVKRVSKARELDKIEDNQEFEAAIREKDILEGRIAELEEVIENATVITKKKVSAVVEIGSTVTVEVKGVHKTLTIVGSMEADPSQGKVSHESPVGRELLGLKEGDIVEIKLPHATVEYKIKKIHR